MIDRLRARLKRPVLLEVIYTIADITNLAVCDICVIDHDGRIRRAVNLDIRVGRIVIPDSVHKRVNVRAKLGIIHDTRCDIVDRLLGMDVAIRILVDGRYDKSVVRMVLLHHRDYKFGGGHLCFELCWRVRTAVNFVALGSRNRHRWQSSLPQQTCLHRPLRNS